MVPVFVKAMPKKEMAVKSIFNGGVGSEVNKE